MPRLTPEIRRKVIIDAAVNVSVEQKSIHNWTREDVAKACAVKTSVETIKHYFPVVDDLRKEAGEAPGTESCVNMFKQK